MRDGSYSSSRVGALGGYFQVLESLCNVAIAGLGSRFDFEQVGYDLLRPVPLRPSPT